LPVEFWSHTRFLLFPCVAFAVQVGFLTAEKLDRLGDHQGPSFGQVQHSDEANMPKELKLETTLVKMRLARRGISLDQARKLLALVQTSIPDEVRAKYLREMNMSTVEADVRVQAQGGRGLNVDATVRVKLTYRGDMVRSSPRVRNKINNRLHEVAQKACSQVVFNEIIPAR